MTSENENIVESEHHAPFFAARQAIRRHATGGNILIVATILAMVVANIPAINHYYFDFWEHEDRGFQSVLPRGRADEHA